MKQFLRMIEVVKQSGIFWLDEAETKKVDPSHFWEMVEKCQPFVFSLSGETAEPPDIVDEHGNTLYAKLDAPFNVFSIEMLDGDITVPFMLKTVKPGVRQVYTHCIMAYEYEPKKYSYYVLGTIVSRGEGSKTFVYSTRTFDKIVEQFIDGLNSQACGTETVREKVKLGSGKSKRFHVIRRIIHVRPKKEKTELTCGGRQIDWSHRWWRRGHWRSLDGLGKDREGNYCVTGFTWVTEHTAGPKDKPVIAKIRMVHESGDLRT